jgi:hypothetical protein
MTKKTYGHTFDRHGKARVVEHKVPKGMRGIDPEWDVHTFKEGPLRRLFSR